MPTLEFSIFKSETNETAVISKLVFQDHGIDDVTELFDYGYDRRGQWYSIPRGSVNTREHVAATLKGTNPKGHIYSFAEQYALNNNLNPNDHIIASFSGSGDEVSGWCQIIDVGILLNTKNEQHKSCIDDRELLQRKFDEIKGK